jgi:hypothetical protein
VLWGYYLDRLRPARYHGGRSAGWCRGAIEPEDAATSWEAKPACSELVDAENADCGFYRVRLRSRERLWSSATVTDVDSMYEHLKP